MGLSVACPLLFNQVQSPGNGASLVSLSALISGGAGAAGAAAAAGACIDGDLPVVAVGIVAEPFPATNSCSAAFSSAVVWLSARACAFSSFTSASSCSIRVLSASISCETVNCCSGCAGFEEAFVSAAGAVAGPALAIIGCVAVSVGADCAKPAQLAPSINANVTAIGSTFFIFTLAFSKKFKHRLCALSYGQTRCSTEYFHEHIVYSRRPR